MTIEWLILALVSIWLGILSFLLFKTLANYNRLTHGVTDKTLSAVLADLLEKQEISDKESQSLKIRVADLENKSLHVIQRIGLVRFNPFNDTGGDQSFSLALLDAQETGIIVTSLYARTGVRWYIKTVKRGKGVEHELSNEEAQSLHKAAKAAHL